MNNAQVAKVVYEARRALKSTQGQDPGKSYEEISDNERSSLSVEMGALGSGAEKGIDFNRVAESITDDKKLEAYISNGIVTGFSQYESALAGSNTLDASGNREASASVDKEVVDADNALARQNAPDPKLGTEESVSDAMAKADSDIAAHNE